MSIGEKLFTTGESYQVFITLYNGGLPWGTAFFTVHEKEVGSLTNSLCNHPDVIAVFRTRAQGEEPRFNLYAVTHDPSKAHKVYESFRLMEPTE